MDEEGQQEEFKLSELESMALGKHVKISYLGMMEEIEQKGVIYSIEKDELETRMLIRNYQTPKKYNDIIQVIPYGIPYNLTILKEEDVIKDYKSNAQNIKIVGFKIPQKRNLTRRRK